MQIQTISNNYQARSQEIQRTQKQNNTSFGAIINYANEGKAHYEIRHTLSSLLQYANDYDTSSDEVLIKFFSGTAALLAKCMRSIAQFNKKPENHIFADTSCTIPIGRISFKTGNSRWADSEYRPNQSFMLGHGPNDIDPKTTILRIDTVSGARVEIPMTASEEEIAKTGERIQNAALAKFDEQSPFDNASDYFRMINAGTESEPLRNKIL